MTGTGYCLTGWSSFAMDGGVKKERRGLGDDIAVPPGLYDAAAASSLHRTMGLAVDKAGHIIAVDANPGGVRGFAFASRPMKTECDVLPASCPNAFDSRGNGLVRGVILGTADGPVETIDLSTIALGGAGAPVRTYVRDLVVKRQIDGACSVWHRDGYGDLVLEFTADQIVAAAGSDNGVGTITFMGLRDDGTPFWAPDMVSAKPGNRIRGDSRRLPDHVMELSYSIPVSADVAVDVFDVAGRRVARLVDGRLPAGDHVVRWDPVGRPNGIYFYRLRADHAVLTGRLVLAR